MKNTVKIRQSTRRSIKSASHIQGRAAMAGSETWQYDLDKARKRFKRISNGRCLSQELIEERAHER